MKVGVDPGIALVIVTTAQPRRAKLDNCHTPEGFRTAESYAQHGDLLEPISMETLCQSLL